MTTIQFPQSSMEGLAIPLDAKTFLEERGLPDSCAPFLTFAFAGSIETVAEKFGLEGEELEEATEFASLPVLGSDGSGNPICIDNEGRVLIVDHGTGFTEAQKVNSSFVHLLESVGVFEVYFQATKGLTPLPSDINAWKHALCDAAKQLQVADHSAYEGFWHSALARDLATLGYDMQHLELGSDLAALIAPAPSS